MRAVAYLRVSKDEEGRDWQSAQRLAIARAAADCGWEVVRWEEDVASGGSARRRPGLARALHELDAGRAELLAVARLDRLSRSLVDFSTILARARRRGWSVAALDVGVDLDAGGRGDGGAAHGLRPVGAAADRRADQGGARRQARARGLAAGGAAANSLGNSPRRIPEDARARVVALRREGLSTGRIAERLDAEGVPARGPRWRRETVRRLLEQESVA